MEEVTRRAKVRRAKSLLALCTWIVGMTLPGVGGATQALEVTIVATHGVGDGGYALQAPIGRPSDIAVDADGNLYVADPINVRIRQVTADGRISTIAGTGRNSYHGDGGASTEAVLDSPAALAVDKDGTVYVADMQNHRVRAIFTDGTIDTVAGNGRPGFSGDGGVAKEAQLHSPSGIAVDSDGNLYVSDTGSNRIRKVGTDGYISTYAGTGIPGAEGDGGYASEAELHSPTLITVDGLGNVYFFDSGNSYVRRIDPDGFIIGARISVEIDGLEADADGNVYVSHLGRVWRSDSEGVAEVVAGTGHTGFSGDGGAALEARFWAPTALALGPEGDLFIVDSRNYLVRRMDSSGKVTSVAGNRSLGRFGDGGPAEGAGFSCVDVAPAPDGALFVSDPLNHRVARIDRNGTITTYAGNGSPGFSGDGGPAGSAQLFAPAGIAVDRSGALYVADHANNRVRKVAVDGTISTIAGNGGQRFAGDGGPADDASLDGPVDVALDGLGNLYISDAGNQRIRRVDPDGTITTVAGNSGSGDPLGFPGGIDVQEDGTIWVSVPSDGAIRRIGTDGSISPNLVDSHPDGALRCNDVAVGSDGSVFVANAAPPKASPSNTQIIRLDPTMTSFTPASSVAIGASGELYLCDAANRRILRAD